MLRPDTPHSVPRQHGPPGRRGTRTFSSSAEQRSGADLVDHGARVQFTVHSEQATPFTLALRIPDWCAEYQLEVNGKSVESQPVRGYLQLERTWTEADQVVLTLAMPVERIAANPMVRQDAGS